MKFNRKNIGRFILGNILVLIPVFLSIIFGISTDSEKFIKFIVPGALVLGSVWFYLFFKANNEEKTFIKLLKNFLLLPAYIAIFEALVYFSVDSYWSVNSQDFFILLIVILGINFQTLRISENFKKDN